MSEDHPPNPPRSAAAASVVRVSPRAPMLSDAPMLDRMLASVSSSEHLGGRQFSVSFRGGEGPVVSPLTLREHLHKRLLSRILDYDPVRHVVLYAGATTPPDITPLFWFLQTGGDPSTMVLFIPLTEMNASLPTTRISCKYLTPKIVMDVFSEVREQSNIYLRDRGLLVRTGPDRMEDQLERSLDVSV